MTTGVASTIQRIMLLMLRKISFYLFLIPVLGKCYLWILKPEWTFVSRWWAFIDLPLYFFTSVWLCHLIFSKKPHLQVISKILICMVLLWEVVLNVILPSENWILNSVFSFLGLGSIFGFVCFVPGYIVLARHGFRK